MRRAAPAVLALSSCKWAAADVVYIKGETQTNVCPFGTSPLQDESGCQLAAGALDLTFGSAGTFTNLPKGCLHWWPDGASPVDSSARVFFNDHSLGRASEHHPICVQGSYYLDVSNTAECSGGMIGLSSEHDCEQAAIVSARAGFSPYTGNLLLAEVSGPSGDWANYPSGCFQFVVPGDPGSLFWNSNAAGKGHASARLVCQDNVFLAAEKTSACEEGRGFAPITGGVSCSVAADRLELSETTQDEQGRCLKGDVNAASHTGVCKQLYVELATESPDCTSSEDLADISGEGACRAAAQALGKQYSSAGTFSTLPFGCSLYTTPGSDPRQEHVYFNNAMGFSSSQHAVPVCRREPTITTTPTATTTSQTLTRSTITETATTDTTTTTTTTESVYSPVFIGSAQHRFSGCAVTVLVSALLPWLGG